MVMYASRERDGDYPPLNYFGMCTSILIIENGVIKLQTRGGGWPLLLCHSLTKTKMFGFESYSCESQYLFLNLPID